VVGRAGVNRLRCIVAACDHHPAGCPVVVVPVVVVVAIAVAATRRAFVSAAGETVPSPVVSSFFDALVDSIRFAFRLVFVLGLVMALLVAIVSLPGYATRWARATQVGVAVIGVGALVALKQPTWGLVAFIVVLVVLAEVALEVARRRGLERAADTTLLVA